MKITKNNLQCKNILHCHSSLPGVTINGGITSGKGGLPELHNGLDFPINGNLADEVEIADIDGAIGRGCQSNWS